MQKLNPQEFLDFWIDGNLPSSILLKGICKDYSKLEKEDGEIIRFNLFRENLSLKDRTNWTLVHDLEEGFFPEWHTTELNIPFTTFIQKGLLTNIEGKTIEVGFDLKSESPLEKSYVIRESPLEASTRIYSPMKLIVFKINFKGKEIPCNSQNGFFYTSLGNIEPYRTKIIKE